MEDITGKRIKLILSQVFLKANKILNGFSKRTTKLLIGFLTFQPVHILMCKAHINFLRKLTFLHQMKKSLQARIGLSLLWLQMSR